MFVIRVVTMLLNGTGDDDNCLVGGGVNAVIAAFESDVESFLA